MRLCRLSIGVLVASAAHLALAAAGDGDDESRNALGRLALGAILQNGRDILGGGGGGVDDESLFSSSSASPPAATSSRYANWMAALPDSVPLARLTLPGTHDAATWNYTQAAQDALAPITATRCPGGTAPGPARVYRCQTRGVADSLDRGVRFLDVRFAPDPSGAARLALWHGPALLSARAGLGDVLFGLYAWLDAHPTEAVVLSLQHERGTRANATTSDAGAQRMLFDELTSPAARRYVHQGRGALGTLGEVRGKVVLFRRFDLDALAPGAEAAMPGLHMSPAQWVDNARSGFELVYNGTTGERAHVEDYYHPGDEYASVAENIDAKFEAVETHLRRAAAGEFGSLFVTFTSGTHVEVEPPVYPDVMALGPGGGGLGTTGPPAAAVRGINHRLVGLLREMKGRRLGVVVMDFFEEPRELIDLLLDF
ncbi:PLC-like phosphodiesterase [Xylaria palmicola]|nr:PLC-like phosphodiesterase [Xylaria palmicola]